MLTPKKLIACLFCCIVQFTHAQDYPNTSYPNVTADLVEDYPMWFYINHKLTVGGAWGVGASFQYNKPKFPHIHLEAGYAFPLAAKKKTEDFKSKSLRPWVDVFAGYPVFTFKRAVKGKYVTDQSFSGDIITESFYKIKVPTTTMIIPQGGFRLNPYPSSVYRKGDFQIFSYSVLYPTFNLGVKVLSISHANIKITDRSSGESIESRTKRMSELYIGLVLPVKKEISAPHPNYNGILSNGVGYEIMFKIPSKLNGVATFEFGLRTLGYNFRGYGSSPNTGKGRTAQFVFSNSFYIN